MLHLYDSSPYSIETQTIRLKAACALSKAHIKSLVWGEDALAFTHFIPANLHALHLVVADQDLRLASTEVINALPYRIFTGKDESYVEYVWMDPDQPRTFPRSSYLKLTTPLEQRSIDDPDVVFIHPQSQFYLNVEDSSHSVTLPSFPDNIRFPTRTAFLDAMIATCLDPPSGRIHSKLRTSLKTWISYFFVYTLRNRPSVLVTGDLEREHAEVLRSLRPENRPYFEALARDESSHMREHLLRRREILEKLGKHDEARRPLPVGAPGNPALIRSVSPEPSDAGELTQMILERDARRIAPMRSQVKAVHTLRRRLEEHNPPLLDSLG